MKNHFNSPFQNRKSSAIVRRGRLDPDSADGLRHHEEPARKNIRSRGSEIDPVPQELANEGMEYLKMDSIPWPSMLSTSQGSLPYSKYAMLAELKIADTLYSQGDYVEGLAAYMEFENLHPKTKHPLRDLSTGDVSLPADDRVRSGSDAGGAGHSDLHPAPATIPGTGTRPWPRPESPTPRTVWLITSSTWVSIITSKDCTKRPWVDSKAW